jgi:hypothetical protein
VADLQAIVWDEEQLSAALEREAGATPTGNVADYIEAIAEEVVAEHGGTGGGGLPPAGSLRNIHIAPDAAIEQAKIAGLTAAIASLFTAIDGAVDPQELAAAVAGAIANLKGEPDPLTQYRLKSAAVPALEISGVLADGQIPAAIARDAEVPALARAALSVSLPIIYDSGSGLLSFNSSAFATAAQGTLANSALQPSAISSTVQAFSGELGAIAAVNTTGVLLRTGVNTWSAGSLGSGAYGSNSVTLSKIQTINTASFLGRVTAGTGNVENLTGAQAFSLLGLGTAAIANVGDFATAAQGLLANTALQTGTAIANISGLQTALNSKQATTTTLTDILTAAGTAVTGQSVRKASAGWEIYTPGTGGGGETNTASSPSTAIGAVPVTWRKVGSDLQFYKLLPLNTPALSFSPGIDTIDISIATVTGSQAGLMAAADFTKLGGIASGATANSSDAQLRDRSTHTGTQAASTITGLGSAALAASSSFATSAQGALAGTALQPGTAISNISGLQTSLDGKQTLDSDLTAIATITTPATDSILSESSTGVWSMRPVADFAAAAHGHGAATGAAAGFLSAADKTKLDGIATAATANATDALLRDRSTHTGTQPVSTITGLGTAATQPSTAFQATNTRLGAIASQANPASLKYTILNTDGTISFNDLPVIDIVAGTTGNLPNSRVSGLGTAALSAASSFATAAQGLLANTALQSGAAISSIANLQTSLDAKQALDSRLTAIASQANPASIKFFQLNTNGTITFVDPPAGGGGGEANTIFSPSTALGAADVYWKKVGTELQLRKLLSLTPAFTLTIGIDTIDMTIAAATGSQSGLLTAADFTKLGGIATGATANSSDALLRDRSTHTGTQTVGTITGLGALATLGVVGTTQITDDAVTLVKIQNIATASFLGRVTAATGDPEVLTVAQAQTLLGLGSAAYTPSTNYATAAQGALAGTALQPGTAIASISGLQTTLDNKQGLNSRLSAIASQANPATIKIPQLNPDGSITFADPASGGGITTINTSAPLLWTPVTSTLSFDGSNFATAAALTSGLAGKQNLAGILTEIAGLSPTNGQVLVRGSSAMTARSLLAADIPDISLTYQPRDSDLDAIAVLATTTYGRSQLTIVDANADRLNAHGRDIQYGSTKPATRSTGTTLVTGDHWFDNSGNSWWCVWDGSRWLTQQVFEVSSTMASTSMAATTRHGIFRVPTATFSLAVLDFLVSTARAAVMDATTNYWTVTLERLTAAQAATVVGTVTLNTALASGADCVNGSAAINTIFSTSSAIAQWRVGWNKLGAAGALSQGTATVRYRLAYV